jgi:hypothetical protein
MVRIHLELQQLHLMIEVRLQCLPCTMLADAIKSASSNATSGVCASSSAWLRMLFTGSCDFMFGCTYSYDSSNVRTQLSATASALQCSKQCARSPGAMLVVKDIRQL